MSPQYLYRISPTRAGFLTASTPQEDAIVEQHFAYLQNLTTQGIVLMAGRTLHTDDGSHGLVVFEAESESKARSVMESDPAVKAGVFRAELFPFSVALASNRIIRH